MKTLKTAIAMTLIAGTTSAMAATSVEANEILAIANASMPTAASTVTEQVETAKEDAAAAQQAVMSEAEAVKTTAEAAVATAKDAVQAEAETLKNTAETTAAAAQDAAQAQLNAAQSEAEAKLAATQAAAQARLEEVRQIIAEKGLTVDDIPALRIYETNNATANMAAMKQAVGEQVAQAENAVNATAEQVQQIAENVDAAMTNHEACPHEAECLQQKAADAEAAVEAKAEKKGWFSWFKKKSA